MSLTVRNATNQPKTLKTTESGGEHTPHNIIDSVTAIAGVVAEDSALSNGASGFVALVQRQDTRAVSSGTTGDATFLASNAQGDLYVNRALTQAAVSASPTCDTSAYADGDLIGGKLSFSSAVRASGLSAIIGQALLVDQAKQQANIDLVLFNADPSGTTFTDQAAFDVADADIDKICAVIRFGTYGDWVPFNDNAIAQYTPPAGIPFKLATGTTLYGAIVSRGTPTFAASTDLKAILSLIQD